jgi:SAM-dependent methyltransferase
MSEALDDVFGWELLQLGTWGLRNRLLAGCRTRRHAVIADCRGHSADTDIAARLSQLPIANGAVDAVLLPHTLEFETDPYAVVREADRVLAGEGQLIVLGFRPFSLWGFRSRAISRSACTACPPRMSREGATTQMRRGRWGSSPAASSGAITGARGRRDGGGAGGIASRMGDERGAPNVAGGLAAA